MELFSALGIDWRGFLWYVFNFLIVLFVLKKFALGPLLKVMDDRAAKIAMGLDDAARAKKLREETEKMRDDVLTAARKQGMSLIEATRQQSEALHMEMLQKARADVESLVAHGKQTLVAERERMVTDAKAELASLVADAVKKVLLKTISAADEKDILKAAGHALKETV